MGFPGLGIFGSLTLNAAEGRGKAHEGRRFFKRPGKEGQGESVKSERGGVRMGGTSLPPLPPWGAKGHG